jgi:2-(1,2-epoxy-1,2-dihydrophenyl)acetyl-CoA isomerase
LIWRSVEDAELMPEVTALARRLADGPRRAQRATVKLIDEAWFNDLPTQLDAEARVQSELSVSLDAEEAIAAFVAKRAPRFTGQ